MHMAGRQQISALGHTFPLCLLVKCGQCHASRTAMPSMLTDTEPSLPPPSPPPPPSVFILKSAFTGKVGALILHRCPSDRG